MDATDDDNADTVGKGKAFAALYAALMIFVALAVVLQLLPLVVPIGPMYWDVLVYYDAIGRISAGQSPVLDFMVPVGPLEPWMAWIAAQIFPEANPVLLTQLSWLPVTAPIMALIVYDVARRSVAAAWGLMLPWMLFTALPFNDVNYLPYAGADAFGIYNRHGAHLLYLVAAVTLFVKRPALQGVILTVLMLSLAFCKITAFAAAGPILILGLITRHIRLRTAIGVAAACLLVVAPLDVATGLVRAYLGDIVLLAEDNAQTLLPRFLTAASQRFDILGAGALLCLVLLIAGVATRNGSGEASEGTEHVEQRRLLGFLDSDWMWIGVTLFCGLAFETQNTGSHPYIMAWPALLRVLLRPRAAHGALRGLVVALVAFTAVPLASKVVHSAIRTAALAPGYIALDEPILGPLGRVSAKDVFVEQAERMRGIYIAHRSTYEAIARTEALPGFLLFSEHDYQYLLLQEIGRAAQAIVDLEAREGVRFETVFNLDFANPFPFILKRAGPKHVAIGADPSRSIPDPDEETLAAVAAADIVLEPKCPYHHARLQLERIYAPALAGRREIQLTPCFDALLKAE